MNTLSDKDLEKIVEIFERLLAKERETLWVDREQHFLDHEMLRQCRKDEEIKRKNHEFVANLREGTDTVKRTSWKMAATGVITFISVAIYLYLKKIFGGN